MHMCIGGLSKEPPSIYLKVHANQFVSSVITETRCSYHLLEKESRPIIIPLNVTPRQLAGNFPVLSTPDFPVLVLIINSIALVQGALEEKSGKHARVRKPEKELHGWFVIG